MTTRGWNPFRNGDESRRLLDTVGDKWNVLILLALDQGEQRYSELLKSVDGISQKVLSQRLGVLTDAGLVSRTSYPEIPPRVVYALTDVGRSASAPARQLFDWSVEHMDDVLSHRGNK